MLTFVRDTATERDAARSALAAARKAYHARPSPQTLDHYCTTVHAFSRALGDLRNVAKLARDLADSPADWQPLTNLARQADAERFAVLYAARQETGRGFPITFPEYS
jgi:hypothetical protein